MFMLGVLIWLVNPPSGIVHTFMVPSSQPVTILELSNGSNAKSNTVVPLMSAGMIPSGIRPVFFVSKSASLPPGPDRTTAIRSLLASIELDSAGTVLLRFFKFSNLSLKTTSPFKCLNFDTLTNDFVALAVLAATFAVAFRAGAGDFSSALDANMFFATGLG